MGSTEKGRNSEGFTSIENYSDRERHLFPFGFLTHKLCSPVSRRQKTIENGALNPKRKLLVGHYPPL